MISHPTVSLTNDDVSRTWNRLILDASRHNLEGPSKGSRGSRSSATTKERQGADGGDDA